MGRLIQPDGTITHHTPNAGRDWSLAELQFLIDGYVERVPTSEPIEAYCNEDGRQRRLALNPVAAVLLQTRLVGPVLVLDTPERVP